MTMPRGWRPPRPSSYSEQPSSYPNDYSRSMQENTNVTKFQELKEKVLSKKFQNPFIRRKKDDVVWAEYTKQNSLVFISYGRENEREAMRLYNDLKDAGLNPWIDRKYIPPGDKEWESKIEDALEKSLFFVALHSESIISRYSGSEKNRFITRYVFNEFYRAIEKFETVNSRAGFITYYIPVRLNVCGIVYPTNENLNQIIRSVGIVDLFPYVENWKKGIYSITQLVEQNIRNINSLGEYWRNAFDLVEKRKYNDAMEYADKALELEPNHPYCLLIKGMVFYYLKRYDEAIKYAESSLKRPIDDASTAMALQLKGDSLRWLKSYPEAIECYDRNLEHEPDNEEVWYNKGLALNAIGKSSLANECFTKANQLGYPIDFDINLIFEDDGPDYDEDEEEEEV